MSQDDAKKPKPTLQNLSTCPLINFPDRWQYPPYPKPRGDADLCRGLGLAPSDLPLLEASEPDPSISAVIEFAPRKTSSGLVQILRDPRFETLRFVNAEHGVVEIEPMEKLMVEVCLELRVAQSTRLPDPRSLSSSWAKLFRGPSQTK